MSTQSPPTEPDNLVREKVEQIPAVLREKGVDAWLIFVRETEMLHDPSLDTAVGANVTWQSAFLFGAAGERVAIVGSLDQTRIERTGVFPRIVGYVKSIRDELRRELGALDPRVLALNYSTDSELADGLTHGMYLLLAELLDATPYLARARSAHAVVGALRGRKSAGELARIRQACALTQQIFDAVTPRLAAGLTEKDVAALIRGEMEARSLAPAWEPEHCPAVFTGPGSAGAHAGPTDNRIEPGHVLNVDFGVRFRGYCSDMQRTWYFLRPGEKAAPEPVARGFATIRNAISAAAAALRPGRPGHEIDAVARGLITSRGYPEYDHALGHQVGRTAHDGAALLGPRWERYGQRVHEPIEPGQVFTLEPRLPIEGHGIATMEEIVTVAEGGCEWLTEPQTDLYLVPPGRPRS